MTDLKEKNILKRTTYLVLITSVLYTLLILFLGLNAVLDINGEAKQYAILQAETHFEKDVNYRNWVTYHGGVYVPKTEETPSNPYLNLPNKDVTTVDGKELTLINPAYMTRQVYELSSKEFNIEGHITSLKPHRPGNAPDEWEKEALKKLNSKNSTVIELVEEDEKKVLKYMGAFYTKKECLKCHGYQNYKIGDVRGGITISLPMDSFLEAEWDHKLRTIINYSTIWILGILIIGYGGKKTKKNWKHVLKTETKFSTMVSTLQDGIIIIDHNKKIQLINESAAEIFEVQETDVIGYDITYLHNELINAKEVEIDFSNHPVYITGSTGKNIYGYIFGFKTSKENIKWISVNVQSLEYDKTTNSSSVLLSARDITEKKNLDSELASYRNHLEKEVHKQTEEIKEVNAQLSEEIKKQKLAEIKIIKALDREKELSELKSTFISTASHEFRTPLTVILSSAEIIEMLSDEFEDKQFSKSIKNIINSVDHLTEIMNDVLIINNTESGKIKFSPEYIMLDEICNDVMKQIDTSLKENQKIIFENKLNNKKQFLDEKQIKLIINNLLSNAIKYSSESSLIHFSIKELNEQIILIVKDNGIGIPEENQKHIFESFQRGKNTHGIPGTGLGLSIVKNAVDLHKGKIEFNSDKNGTEFIISIPSE